MPVKQKMAHNYRILTFLQSITKQTHDNIETICFINKKQNAINAWWHYTYIYPPTENTQESNKIYILFN